MKEFVYEGRLTLAIEFAEREEYAILENVEIGNCDTTPVSLSDAEDVLLYCKMLSEKIGIPVYRNEKHAHAGKLTNWQLNKLLDECVA